MKNIDKYKEVLAVSLYNRSREWGAKFFLRKPLDLEPKLIPLWNMMTGNARFISQMSDAEKAEFRVTMRDAFAVEPKDRMDLEFIPRIMLRTKNDSPEPLLHISSIGSFLRATGSRTSGRFTNETASEVTFEDVQWYLNQFPQEKLEVLAVNLELSKKHKGALVKEVLPIISDATKKFFETIQPLSPVWELLDSMDMTSSDKSRMARIFEQLNPLVKHDEWTEYSKRSGLAFVPHCAVKLTKEWGGFDEGTVLLHTGKADATFFHKPWVMEVPSDPSCFCLPTDEEIKKALKNIPIEYKIPAVPFEIIEAWLEEDDYANLELGE
jgi:hypothetical protein